MLRSILIYLSTAPWAQKMITNWGFARWAASRFIAGSTIEEAISAIKVLNNKGINATLDQLGEHTSNAEEANKAADGIISVLNEINRAGVRANMSIKLTQIGLGMDDKVCKNNLIRILETAKKLGNFVRIDIEDSPFTDKTYQLFLEMLDSGFTVRNVGVAAQSYLYRAESDVRKLVERGTSFRLVKGAYQEPASIAYPKKTDVDANFDTLASILIDASLAQNSEISENGLIPPIPAIGSHDEKRIAFVKSYIEKVGLPRSGMEFQMLYGIRRDIQDSLAKEGYFVRVYVPFGTHWYPYFMRRLAERPANLWFFISNYFKN